METIKKNSTIKKLERTDAMDESRQNIKKSADAALK